MIPLSDILNIVYRPITLIEDSLYRLIGIRLYGEGVYIREEKYGKDIGANTLYEVHKGDFIYSRLFAWKGAFGVATENDHNALASNEFPIFKSKKENISIDYIKEIILTPSLWEIFESLCTGTTKSSRNRLSVDDFLSVKIPVATSKNERLLFIQYCRIIKKYTELVRELLQTTNASIHMTRLQNWSKSVGNIDV